MSNVKIYFYGGVGHVTGANFILEEMREGKTFRIMVDCGLAQGGAKERAKNHEPFPYTPREIDALIVTHAHMDHIGRIPKLVKDGFRGAIYSTEATSEIVVPMFDDQLNLMQISLKEYGEKPLFNENDVEMALSLWNTRSYYTPFEIGPFSVLFKDAGHILGSVITRITYQNTHIVFTGDLGNSPAPFLRDTDEVDDATYMVMESVYGDRNHEDSSLRSEKLKKIIEKAIEKKGTLLIPAFSLERTQIILYEINNLVESGQIPKIPVFLDSPLAIKITEIYRKYSSLFKEEVKEQITKGDEIFNFPNLEFTPSIKDSTKIHNTPAPKIIIAGSGMSYGGRILAHEEEYLSDARNTILFVGYQASGSLGRQIQEGKKEILVSEKRIPVRATIESIMSYSSHKDSDGLLSFVEKSVSTLKKVFVVMGEPKSSMFLAQRIRDYLDVEAVAPEEGQSFSVDF